MNRSLRALRGYLGCSVSVQCILCSAWSVHCVPVWFSYAMGGCGGFRQIWASVHTDWGVWCCSRPRCVLFVIQKHACKAQSQKKGGKMNCNRAASPANALWDKTKLAWLACPGAEGTAWNWNCGGLRGELLQALPCKAAVLGHKMHWKWNPGAATASDLCVQRELNCEERRRNPSSSSAGFIHCPSFCVRSGWQCQAWALASAPCCSCAACCVAGSHERVQAVPAPLPAPSHTEPPQPQGQALAWFTYWASAGICSLLTCACQTLGGNSQAADVSADFLIWW